MAKELAKPTNGKSDLSSRRSVSLNEVILRFCLRYRAEMGDLERADWLETLKMYELREVLEAMNHLMHNPPKQVLPDGEMQDWTGMPTLVQLTQTIAMLREQRSLARRAEEAEKAKRLFEAEKKRREEHPEEFMGLGDFIKRLAEENPELAAKANLGKLEK